MPLKQMGNAIKIAHFMFPDAIIHWVFDNSSAHGSLTKDALTITKMNINPGGKNVPDMHDTIILASNPFGHGGKIQKVQFDKDLPKGHPDKAFQGQPKSIKRILQEWGYLQNGKKLVGDCKACKKSQARKPHLTGMTEDKVEDVDGDGTNDTEKEDEGRPVNCCMWWILSLQDDFQNEKSKLETVCLFHCPAKIFWQLIYRWSLL